MVIVATHPNDLDAVTHNVHDLWIDVEALAKTRDYSTLNIELFQDGQLRQSRGVLTIDEVESVQVDDSQGIGGYDIGRIEYCPTDNRLEFIMNIPCKCEMRVKALHLTLRINN